MVTCFLETDTGLDLLTAGCRSVAGGDAGADCRFFALGTATGGGVELSSNDNWASSTFFLEARGFLGAEAVPPVAAFLAAGFRLGLDAPVDAPGDFLPRPPPPLLAAGVTMIRSPRPNGHPF